MDTQVLRNLSYGLFVLTTKIGIKDNGCIINVASQVTDNPVRIVIAVNKGNLTHDLVLSSGVFNLNILTEETPMKVFEHFGFQSGRDVNKFADCEVTMRSDNGLLYLPKYSNSYISGKVVETVDMGTHTLFVAEVTEAVKLSDAKSLTYTYYHEHIKPKPTVTTDGTTKWVCQICGYEYEGAEVPDDFICPWCSHGKADFVKVE